MNRRYQFIGWMVHMFGRWLEGTNITNSKCIVGWDDVNKCKLDYDVYKCKTGV